MLVGVGAVSTSSAQAVGIVGVDPLHTVGGVGCHLPSLGPDVGFDRVALCVSDKLRIADVIVVDVQSVVLRQQVAPVAIRVLVGHIGCGCAQVVRGGVGILPGGGDIAAGIVFLGLGVIPEVIVLLLKPSGDWDYPNNLPLGVQRRCLLAGLLAGMVYNVSQIAML